MNDYKVAIIGYGVVGQNLCREIGSLNPDIYDKYTDVIIQQHQKANRWDGSEKYDFAFICVDTPLKENGVDLDTSEVASAIHNTNAEIYVIKSTCPVGFTNTLAHFVHKHIVYCPEYYGGTQHCNNFNFDFTILGGNKQDCIEVQQLLQGCYDARHTFHITDHDTAELVKFMENAWIATKVSFCNQFYEIAEAKGVSYEDLRELFILDPRVNSAHTFVYREHPYWDSHCLNKDVPHIANSCEQASLLKYIINFNNQQKENNHGK
jgi:nucleotide sugar dehydrogenase